MKKADLRVLVEDMRQLLEEMRLCKNCKHYQATGSCVGCGVVTRHDNIKRRVKP